MVWDLAVAQQSGTKLAGKWNQRLKPVVCPSCLIFSHAQIKKALCVTAKPIGEAAASLRARSRGPEQFEAGESRRTASFGFSRRLFELMLMVAKSIAHHLRNRWLLLIPQRKCQQTVGSPRFQSGAPICPSTVGLKGRL